MGRLLWRMASAPASYVLQKFPIVQTVGDTLISCAQNHQQHSTEIRTEAPQGIKEAIISVARNYNPYQQSKSDKALIEELQAKVTDLEAELANKSELEARIEELEAELAEAHRKAASDERELLAKCEENSIRNRDRLLWRMARATASYVLQKFPIVQTVGDTLISYTQNHQQHSTEIRTEAPQGIKEATISVARNYNPYQQSK